MTHPARRLWRLIEAINGVTYFAPRCRDAMTDLGLKGFWMGYFAARAAPVRRGRARTGRGDLLQLLPRRWSAAPSPTPGGSRPPPPCSRPAPRRPPTCCARRSPASRPTRPRIVPLLTSAVRTGRARRPSAVRRQPGAPPPRRSGRRAVAVLHLAARAPRRRPRRRPGGGRHLRHRGTPADGRIGLHRRRTDPRLPRLGRGRLAGGRRTGSGPATSSTTPAR